MEERELLGESTHDLLQELEVLYCPHQAHLILIECNYAVPILLQSIVSMHRIDLYTILL